MGDQERVAFHVSIYRRLIEAVYHRWNHEKLDDVPRLMEKYKSDEAEIYDRIVRKYVFTRQSIDWQPLVESMYQRFNPSKLPDMSTILSKYDGSEAALYRALCDKYLATLEVGEEPLEFDVWDFKDRTKRPSMESPAQQLSETHEPKSQKEAKFGKRVPWRDGNSPPRRPSTAQKDISKQTSEQEDILPSPSEGPRHGSPQKDDSSQGKDATEMKRHRFGRHDEVSSTERQITGKAGSGSEKADKAKRSKKSRKELDRGRSDEAKSRRRKEESKRDKGDIVISANAGAPRAESEKRSEEEDNDMNEQDGADRSPLLRRRLKTSPEVEDRLNEGHDRRSPLPRRRPRLHSDESSDAEGGCPSRSSRQAVDEEAGGSTASAASKSKKMSELHHLRPKAAAKRPVASPGGAVESQAPPSQDDAAPDARTATAEAKKRKTKTTGPPKVSGEGEALLTERAAAAHHGVSAATPKLSRESSTIVDGRKRKRVRRRVVAGSAGVKQRERPDRSKSRDTPPISEAFPAGEASQEPAGASDMPQGVSPSSDSTAANHLLLGNLNHQQREEREAELKRRLMELKAAKQHPLVENVPPGPAGGDAMDTSADSPKFMRGAHEAELRAKAFAIRDKAMAALNKDGPRISIPTSS